MAQRTSYGESVIDLKTGQIGTAWLQIGGYIALLNRSVEYGGVLHIPRVRIDKETKGARWNSGRRGDCGRRG